MTNSIRKNSRSLQVASRALAVSLAFAGVSLATPALATCVADGTGLIVTCTGTSGTYTNTNTGVTVTTDTTGTITGPMTIGSTATVTNSGTFNGAAGTPALTVGANSNVTNATGAKLIQAGTTAGSEGVVLGDYSTLTNNGTLTAAQGFNVARFGKGGTFVNNASAPVAVTGNVVFGVSLGADVSSYTNNNTAFGHVGNVSASGNLNFTNAGKFSGAVVQLPAGGTVNFTNTAAGDFSGVISTGDTTVLVNNGTMTLTGGSVIASFNAAGTSVTNNNRLNLGVGSTIGTLDVNGNFVQAAGGTLGVAIRVPGTAGPVAGATFSQLHTTGTAALGGTLALTVAPGYYATNSTYNVVIGDAGVSGNFSAITGNQLTYISFVPVGIVNLTGGRQAYQLQVQRTATYAAGLGSSATANQTAIATAFQPMVAYADANPNSSAAALVGAVDVLTPAQAQTFFDSVSPAGYLAYAHSMQDHANLFQRQVSLRMNDHHAENSQRGWWLNFGMQAFNSNTTGTDKTRTTGWNLAGGYDFSGTNYVAGIALGYANGKLKYAPGSMEGKDSAYQIGAYASLKLKPLSANVVVDYQFGKIDVNKTITVGTGAAVATANANSKLLTVTGTLGLDLEGGGVAFRPFAGVVMHRGSIDGFTEDGAGAARLIVNQIDADRTDFIAGATLTRNNGAWRPYVKGAYRSTIGTAPNTGISARFVDVTGTNFTVTGRGTGKDEIDIDAGLNWVSEDEGGLFIAYQGTFRDDITSHGVVGGIRIQF